MVKTFDIMKEYNHRYRYVHNGNIQISIQLIKIKELFAFHYALYIQHNLLTMTMENQKQRKEDKNIKAIGEGIHAYTHTLRYVYRVNELQLRESEFQVMNGR